MSRDVLYYRRPAELAGLGRRHAVVESSAGTGKTFLLEHLFIDLILSHGLSCDEILVVTFTEKATAELVLRLRGLLERLVHLRPDDPQVVPARDAGPASVWTIDAPARARLADNLLGFDRATISTIHGFCQRILREHAFVQARFFDEEVVAKEAALGRAFHDVLRAHTGRDEVGAALAAWLGSGRQIAELEELLRACDEERACPVVPRLDGEKLQAALAAWRDVGTPAEIERCLRLARVNARSIGKMLDRVGRIAEVVAASEGDGMRALLGFDRLLSDKTAKDSFDYLVEKLAGFRTPACMATLAAAVSGLAEAVVPLEAWVAGRLLSLVRERALAHKRRAGWFDFTDMLAFVAQALALPEATSRPLVETLRRRYRHALIDEFQDTDETQWSIFRRLFAEDPAHGLTVIGDPKQAIYRFRGADVHAYLGARDHLIARGATRLVLDRNFRSTSAMVDATNAIFDQRAEFFRSGSGIRYDEPVRCARTELALVGDAAQAGKPIVVLDVKGQQAKLSPTGANAVLRGAIVEEIAALLRPESPLRLRDGSAERKLLARNIFVLTFTNAESRAIGKALRDAGIAHAFYKLGNLFESAEAEEVLVLLRAVAEPERRGLRAHAFLTRFFDMEITAVAAALDLGVEAPGAKLLYRLSALARAGDIPALFTAIVDETGLVRRELFAGHDERTLTNVTHVLEILQTHWTRTHASLPELVDVLAAYVYGHQTVPVLDGDLQRLETDKDAVQILTVHKAKGLEADVVFLYGGITEGRKDTVHVLHEEGRRILHVGRLGEARRQLVEKEFADERSRLLYVALTRARFRMVLPHYDAAIRSRSPYLQANQRLTSLLDDASARELFAVQPIVAAPARGMTTATLPPASTAPELPRADEPPDIATIRSGQSGFLVTSYSAIQRARNSQVAERGLDDETEMGLDGGGPVRFDNTDRPSTAVADAAALPRGAETGIFLHDLLATVVLDELSPDFAAWSARPSVARWLAKAGKRHGRREADLVPAARLVHKAYTSPVALGDGRAARLASASGLLRETEFLFPIPETAHPLLSRPSDRDATWMIERGAVRGFIDFLFEHDGRIFVCDWKSDDLGDFGPAALAAHCREHYDLQARLYILATLRLFAIDAPTRYAQRFGGMVFCFLRGLPDAASDVATDSRGVHFFRPTWSDILGWEQDLLRPGVPGVPGPLGGLR